MPSDALVFRRKLIFVMGMQRSGTTALAESLGQDPALHVEHESPGNAFYDDYFLRPEPELRPLLWRIKRRVLLKPISETQRRSVEEVLDEFADYDVQAVWIYRDPINVWSSMQVEFGLEESRREGWAFQWNQGNRSLLDALYGPHRERIVVVRYEDLIAHRATHRAMCRFLGVEERNNLFWREDANKGRHRLPDAIQADIEATCGETLAELHRQRLFVHWVGASPLAAQHDDALTAPERRWSIGQVEPIAAQLTGDATADGAVNSTAAAAGLRFVLPRRQWQQSVQLLHGPWSVRKGQRYTWGCWLRASQAQSIGLGFEQMHWPRRVLADPVGVDVGQEYVWRRGVLLPNRDEEQAHLWIDVRRPTLREHWWRLPAHLQRAMGYDARADLDVRQFRLDPGDLPVYRLEAREGGAGAVQFDPRRPDEIRLAGLSSPRREPTDVQFITHELETTAGAAYIATLRLKSDARRPLAFSVGLAEEPWTSFHYVPLEATPEWQTFHWAFSTPRSCPIRAYLDLGASDVAIDLGEVAIERRARAQMHLDHHQGYRAALRPGDDPEIVRVEVQAAPTRDESHLQLCQFVGPVEAGRRYAVAFRIRAEQPRRASCGVHQSTTPWRNLGFHHRLDLRTSWQTYYWEFEAQLADDVPRFHLNLGGGAIGVECSRVWVTAIDPQLSADDLARLRRALQAAHPAEADAALSHSRG